MAPPPEFLRADVVVIGSGAGGAPTAAVLAESGLDVVILEVGSHRRAADFSADEGEMTVRLGRMTATSNGAQNLYAGRCVGGSTVINDALCWRPPPDVLEDWRRVYGLEDLSESGLSPFVERAWRDVHAEATGPDHRNRNSWRLELGARRLGWAGDAMPRNVRGCANLGRCNLGCPIDAKQSTLVTYVPRALAAGARLLPDTRADRISIDAGAVRGVLATSLDPETGRPVSAVEIVAPRVIVAGGVLATGALLRRSGIPGGGDSAGRGLQFHSSLHVAARFDEPVHGYYGPTMSYAIEEWSDVGGRGGPGYMIENTAVRPVVTASALPGFGEEHAKAMDALPYLARSVIVLRDRARGEIRPDGESGIVVDYALLPEDRERLRHAIDRTARAYLAADAREVFLPVNGLKPVRREADLAALADAPIEPSRLSFLYAVHLFGGAAMGGDRSASTCSVEGRVWDVRGLFVSDASSLPSNTGVNPQITIMANALRIADGIASGAAT